MRHRDDAALTVCVWIKRRDRGWKDNEMHMSAAHPQGCLARGRQVSLCLTCATPGTRSSFIEFRLLSLNYRPSMYVFPGRESSPKLLNLLNYLIYLCCVYSNSHHIYKWQILVADQNLYKIQPLTFALSHTSCIISVRSILPSWHVL